MERYSKKQQDGIFDFPPCHTPERLSLCEGLVFTMNPAWQSYRRRVTMRERLESVTARDADFVLVKKVGDDIERSYHSYNPPKGEKHG
jgi:hypothetical protein